jgi:hypothetical protein
LDLTEYFRIAKSKDTSANHLISATHGHLALLESLHSSYDASSLFLIAKSPPTSRISKYWISKAPLGKLFKEMSAYANMLGTEIQYNYIELDEVPQFHWEPVLAEKRITNYLKEEVVLRLASENGFSISEAEVYLSLLDGRNLDLGKFFPA